MIKINDSLVDGIFPKFITPSVTAACGQCPSYQSLEVNYFRTKFGRYADQRDEQTVKNKVNDDVHVSFPIYGDANVKTFAGFYYFIGFVNSPGFAVVVRDDYKSLDASVIYEGIFKLWPVFLINVLLAYMFGIMIWMAVSISLC